MDIMEFILKSNPRKKSAMYLALFFLLTIPLFLSCKDDDVKNEVIWSKHISGNNLISDMGLGYPIFNKTVVFHSSPNPANTKDKIIYGLDADTGKEKWQLTNKDFFPKKELEFSSLWYYYQYNNKFVCCDRVTNLNGERYIYSFDIDNGKVLWVKELPNEYDNIGLMIKGKDNVAYIDAQKGTDKFTLIKIDINSGNYSELLSLTRDDIPASIPVRNLSFFQASEIYQNELGDDLIALSLNSYDGNIDQYKVYMTLFVYNLTTNKRVYSVYVNPQASSIQNWDTFLGRVAYVKNKLIVGMGKNVYCFDAFNEKEVLWKHSTILNDGIGMGSGNDNVFQLIPYDNLAIVYCADHIMALNTSDGSLIYNVKSASGSAAGSIIEGVLYCEDNNDFLMRDPNTGKELKRISTGKNAEGFAGSRPNGKDGKIYIHSYTDAYCIKAFGK